MQLWNRRKDPALEIHTRQARRVFAVDLMELINSLEMVLKLMDATLNFSFTEEFAVCVESSTSVNPYP